VQLEVEWFVILTFCLVCSERLCTEHVEMDQLSWWNIYWRRGLTQLLRTRTVRTPSTVPLIQDTGKTSTTV